jgi:general nucleoside transport system ATP-binding protein
VTGRTPGVRAGVPGVALESTNVTPALECDDVTVTYGDVVALRQVGVAFARGGIHAVVGQNGAGKTTIARVCAGIVQPSSGRMLVHGKEVRTGDVNRARAAGVELVHQSFALPPSFTVAEAMEFGSQRSEAFIYSRKQLEERWRHHLDGLGVAARMNDRIRDLPVEKQQGVEIARALVAKAKILILDEPTAVLAPTAIETLFDRVRRLQQSGVTILLILHKIREVLRIAETVTVLRGGLLVEGPLAVSQVDANGLASAIIGSAAVEGLDVASEDRAALVGAEDGSRRSGRAAIEVGASPVLAMKGVKTKPVSDGPPLGGIDLHLAKGEILGLAGVEGNGQRTLVRALAGLAPLQDGKIALSGRDVTNDSLIDRRAHGLRIIPFERYTEGLSLASPLWENWAVRKLLLGSLVRLISPGRLRRESQAAFKQWDVRFAAVDQPAGSLSGGNAQKIILAREVDEEASLIVAAQPTRGLDVGATAFVWKSLRNARSRGRGVLLISSDLDELFDISDRIVVMLSGNIVAEFRPPYDLGAVGAAMTGARH